MGDEWLNKRKQVAKYKEVCGVVGRWVVNKGVGVLREPGAQEKESKERGKEMEVSKLGVLATAALWVRIQTSHKKP